MMSAETKNVTSWPAKIDFRDTPFCIKRQKGSLNVAIPRTKAKMYTAVSLPA
jgi:hypothetical protein